MRIRVRIPGTLEHPAPAELANYATPRGPDATPGQSIYERDRSGATTTIRYRITEHHSPRAAIKVDFLRNMRLYTAHDAALAARYVAWWESTGAHAADTLAAWQDFNAATGTTPTPQADGAEPPAAQGRPRQPPPPQDIFPYGTPGRTTPNATDNTMPRPRFAQVPPYTIKESAAQAAEWLAQHWPKDVAAIGYSAFIEARKRDVLDMIWTPRYWRPLERLDPQACVSIAYNTLDPDWESAPIHDEEHRRGLTTYGAASAPYPLPPPYSTGDQPSPGWRSAGTYDHLADLYHACWIETFKTDKPYYTEDMTPVFFETISHHYVTADAAASRVQFSTYSQPYLFQEDADTAGATRTIVFQGRRFNWTNKIPPSTPGNASIPYYGHMKRHFVQDFRVMALLDPASNGAFDRVAIQLGPGAAIGRYFGRAASIQTEYLLENPAAYIAKKPTEDMPELTARYDLSSAVAWLTSDVGVPLPPPRIALTLQRMTDYTAEGTHRFPWGSATLAGAYSGRHFSVEKWHGTSDPGANWVQELNYVIAYAAGDNHEKNLAQFGNFAGDNLQGTAWQLSDGTWHNAPGSLSWEQIIERTA